HIALSDGGTVPTDVGRPKNPENMVGPLVPVRRVMATLAAVILPFTQVKAQVIVGKVVEFRSDIPIEGAQITLLDSKKRELAVQSRTDSVGQFALRVPEPGRYIVRAR